MTDLLNHPEPKPCAGPHTKLDVTKSMVAVHCTLTGATYWYRRCDEPTVFGRCASYTYAGSRKCHRHSLGTRS